MSVICDLCQTTNRDNANFCRGCAAKLPGFAATGPSQLEMMREHSPPVAPQRSGDHGDSETRIRPSRFWLRFGGLLLLAAICFAAWSAYVLQRPAITAVTPPGQVTPAPPALPTPPASPTPAAQATPATPVALQDTLAPGESPADTATPSASAVPASPPAPAAPVHARTAAAAASAAVPGTRVRPPAARDPQVGCTQFNFIRAAYCEAAHCDQPAYAAHPRCNAVRAERARDEARRNPMMSN